METREIRTTALPELDDGDVWGTGREGVFVVVSSRAAEWRGEDRDVYSHIDRWYTVRPASPAEVDLWEQAVAATIACRELRKTLGAGRGWELRGTQLCPPEAATRMLDSYDDRWTPPVPIELTPEQVEIEQRAIGALLTLKNHVSQ
jgi:hypothetical protein